MGMRRRFSFVCLVVLEDTLADLEGILDEIRFQSGASWPEGGIRRRRRRLLVMMRAAE